MFQLNKIPQRIKHGLFSNLIGNSTVLHDSGTGVTVSSPFTLFTQVGLGRERSSFAKTAKERLEVAAVEIHGLVDDLRLKEGSKDRSLCRYQLQGQPRSFQEAQCHRWFKKEFDP